MAARLISFNEMVLTATSGAMTKIVPVRHGFFLLYQREKNELLFIMDTGIGDLMHECFDKYSRMGTARMKYDKESEDEGKKRGLLKETDKEGK